MSDIKTLEKRAMEIHKRYAELEIEKEGRVWDAVMLSNGFKKDVADLIEIVGHKPLNNKKLEHELADCLWSVLVIARKLNVDIEAAFWRTMDELDQRFVKGKA